MKCKLCEDEIENVIYFMNLLDKGAGVHIKRICENPIHQKLERGLTMYKYNEDQ